MKVEKILEQLIKFNTANDKENGEIINWLNNFCFSLGLKTKILKNKEKNKSSLIAYTGNFNKTGLLFLGHTDTVPAGQGWKTNPLKLSLKSNNFYGLGSADMKGGIAAMLAALNETKPNEFKKGLSLIFTYDEEKTFGGIKDVVEKYKLKSDCILVGEPTDLKPIIATKGIMVFKVKFIGEEAHGSNPESGVNAIEMASIFILEMKKYFKKLEKTKDDIFNPPFAILNIAKIKGGDAINKVPAHCFLEFEIRTIGKNQIEELQKSIFRIIKRNKLKAEIDMNFRLPVMKNTNNKFISMIEDITKKNAGGVNYATENSFLPDSNNNFVVLGPGSIDFAHKANENIDKKSLYKAIEIYKELIGKFCN